MVLGERKRRPTASHPRHALGHALVEPPSGATRLAERLLSHSRENKSSSPSSNPHVEHFSGAASSTNPHMAFAKFGAVPATASASAAQSLQYEGNNFDGAVLGGRPKPPSDLGSGARAMADAVATPATPQPTRTKCEILLLISSAAGYERRRKVIRSTYLAALKASPALASRVQVTELLAYFPHGQPSIWSQPAYQAPVPAYRQAVPPQMHFMPVPPAQVQQQ